MEKRELMYEGKAKKVFKTDDADAVIVSYKDDATAFNGQKKGQIAGKGTVNNKCSNFMFAQLEKHGIETHLIGELSDTDALVKKVEIDFKIEFGRFHGKILLADEISPDTCRFWDTVTHEKLDKDRFRRDLGNVEEAYREVLARLMGEKA